MEELKDHPGPSIMDEHQRKKFLFLCFGEYYPGTSLSYLIHAFDLGKNCNILPLAESRIVGKIGLSIPAVMGFGVRGSNIFLVGGIKPSFNGYGNFTPYLCRDVLEFDTKKCFMIPPNLSVPFRPLNPTPVMRHRPLQQGKNYPLVVEHDSKLYVLSCRSLMSTCGVHFAPGFEMLDPTNDKWVTLPEPPIFHRRYLGRTTNCVVVGTNIFVSCLSSIFRFDMADTSQKWNEHFFTNCIRLPFDFDGRSLAVKMRDGNWLIFTCYPELCEEADEFEDDAYCCCYEDDCFFPSGVGDYPPQAYRHFEWKRTSLPTYLMSSDFTSLTRLQPLCLPDDLLPTQPGLELLPMFRDLFTARAREIDYRILHLGGHEICLVLSVDTGFESKGGVLRKMPIFVIRFEFELSDSRELVTIKTGSCGVQCFLLDANGPRATKVSMHGAFWL
ncbi:PREDICTED: uncharacterized protein LOC103321619 [Prunus mume]|uniref:Uncharacterized protein LOC103321619 n=1 Tax=Prunus mume TaxID=102107 RepID=A0ABM0NA24_PRUMU|nr:PREDICTED: uncharacterized protein LOC103321619 [Prunus mume]